MTSQIAAAIGSGDGLLSRVATVMCDWAHVLLLQAGRATYPSTTPYMAIISSINNPETLSDANLAHQVQQMDRWYADNYHFPTADAWSTFVMSERTSVTERRASEPVPGEPDLSLMQAWKQVLRALRDHMNASAAWWWAEPVAGAGTLCSCADFRERFKPVAQSVLQRLMPVHAWLAYVRAECARLVAQTQGTAPTGSRVLVPSPTSAFTAVAPREDEDWLRRALQPQQPQQLHQQQTATPPQQQLQQEQQQQLQQQQLQREQHHEPHSDGAHFTVPQGAFRFPPLPPPPHRPASSSSDHPPVLP